METTVSSSQICEAGTVRTVPMCFQRRITRVTPRSAISKISIHNCEHICKHVHLHVIFYHVSSTRTCKEYFIVSCQGSWKNGGYDEVESVPSCVESHLEEVLFTYTQGEDPQYHLEKFILKNGGELKKFHVHNRRLESNEILKKFYAFPKVSTSLTFSTPGLAESLKLVEEWGYRY